VYNYKHSANYKAKAM